MDYKGPRKPVKVLKTTFKILLLAILLVAVAFVGGKYYGYYKNTKTLETADRLVIEGDYEEALKEYKKINKNYKREEIEEKVSKAKELIKSKTIFEEGNESILRGRLLESSNMSVKRMKSISKKLRTRFWI